MESFSRTKYEFCESLTRPSPSKSYVNVSTRMDVYTLRACCREQMFTLAAERTLNLSNPAVFWTKILILLMGFSIKQTTSMTSPVSALDRLRQLMMLKNQKPSRPIYQIYSR